MADIKRPIGNQKEVITLCLCGSHESIEMKNNRAKNKLQEGPRTWQNSHCMPRWTYHPGPPLDKDIRVVNDDGDHREPVVVLSDDTERSTSSPRGSYCGTKTTDIQHLFSLTLRFGDSNLPTSSSEKIISINRYN
ncbi:hypothetical protein J6590_047016 [Homalodisca vitripennis]|nr:hypothetical protein J6590_047016 [Homalodisca vitripennis]